jgi:predicted restriction endonuclease
MRLLEGRQFFGSTAMTERRTWSRPELVVAMNLYCKLPFGRLNHKTPEIMELATALGRTASSVSMKLCNFASFDPALQARGVKGLTGASRADRAVWDEFHNDWDALAAESEALAAELIATAKPGAGHPADAKYESNTSFDGPTDAERVVRVRLAQRFFRQTVLASYSCRCCITGNPAPELLVAGHIVPWSTHPQHRTNPRNGLTLARTHDAAFDSGLITFDEELRLVVSRELKDYLPADAVRRDFASFEGRPMLVAEKLRPEAAFMEHHRQRVFRG